MWKRNSNNDQIKLTSIWQLKTRHIIGEREKDWQIVGRHLLLQFLNSTMIHIEWIEREREVLKLETREMTLKKKKLFQNALFLPLMWCALSKLSVHALLYSPRCWSHKSHFQLIFKNRLRFFIPSLFVYIRSFSSVESSRQNRTINGNWSVQRATKASIASHRESCL